MLLDRLFDIRSEVITTSAELDAFLRASAYGGDTASGMSVNAETAMRVVTVMACVRVLSETLAQVPLILYRRLPDGGKERAVSHPLYRILHDTPNAYMTSFEFRELLQGHLGLRGNAYAFKAKYRTGPRRGQLFELLPVHPDRVTVEQDDRYNVVYKIVMPDGTKREFKRDDILHIKGMSSDGLVGLSPIALHREAIGLSMVAEKHGAKMFANGAMVGGVLEHPNILSDEALAHLKESIEKQYTGTENAFRTLILEEGMKWQSIGMTNEDAQFLELRKFQRNEIASIFRIQPHMIGDLDRATHSNIEHQSLEFVQYTMMPWFARWEQALSAALLTEEERQEYFFEFLVDGLLRGDIKTRYEAYHYAITDGWMSRNEARTKENMNPVDGLEEFLRPLNMDVVGEQSDAT